jgi:hypothetical protein
MEPMIEEIELTEAEHIHTEAGREEAVTVESGHVPCSSANREYGSCVTWIRKSRYFCTASLVRVRGRLSRFNRTVLTQDISDFGAITIVLGGIFR